MGEEGGRAMHNLDPMGNFYPLMHLGRMQNPNRTTITAYLLRQRYPLITYVLRPQAPLNKTDPLCAEADQTYLSFWGNKRRFCGVVLAGSTCAASARGA